MDTDAIYLARLSKKSRCNVFSTVTCSNINMLKIIISQNIKSFGDFRQSLPLSITSQPEKLGPQNQNERVLWPRKN